MYFYSEIIINKIINRGIAKYLDSLKNLSCINYNNEQITYNSINSFNKTERKKNYSSNKIRENIIGVIINNKIPEDYYKYLPRWNIMRENIKVYITELFNTKYENIYIKTIECIHKGGRKFNYDFNIIINTNISFNVEFKFNCNRLDNIPQFVSPMKPSQYFSESYEEYYYDNYLCKLFKLYNLIIPDKTKYLNSIHSPKPKCIEESQKKYYNGCKQSSKFTNNIDDKFLQRC